MPALILRDANGQELGRRPMEPSERIDLYRRFNEGECLTFEGKCFKLRSVVYRKPEGDCVVLVSFDSWEPNACDCD